MSGEREKGESIFRIKREKEKKERHGKFKRILSSYNINLKAKYINYTEYGSRTLNYVLLQQPLTFYSKEKK